MQDIYEKVQDAVSYLFQAIGTRPRVALILGTGLGGLAERIRVDRRISYGEIPHFSPVTVESHKGDLIFGTLGACTVVAMQGRIHYYEGYTLQQTTLPVRVMRALGARALIINSAAGGLNPMFQAGDLMIVTDHINLIGDNPLRGVTDHRLGDRFPDMSRPYDVELIGVAEEAAAHLKIPVRKGVYVAVSGPSFETPAETRMLRTLGADAVGMSTVPEVIVACQVGFRTLALVVVTNVNIPDAMEPVLAENAIAAARRAEPKLAALVEETIRRTGKTFAAAE